MELRIIQLEDDLDVTGKLWDRLLLCTSVGTREKVVPRLEGDGICLAVSTIFEQASGHEFDPDAPND